MPLFEDWQLEPMPLYVAFPPSRHVSRKLLVLGLGWGHGDGTGSPTGRRGDHARCVASRPDVALASGVRGD